MKADNSRSTVSRRPTKRTSEVVTTGSESSSSGLSAASGRKRGGGTQTRKQLKDIVKSTSIIQLPDDSSFSGDNENKQRGKRSLPEDNNNNMGFVKHPGQPVTSKENDNDRIYGWKIANTKDDDRSARISPRLDSNDGVLQRTKFTPNASLSLKKIPSSVDRRTIPRAPSPGSIIKESKYNNHTLSPYSNTTASNTTTTRTATSKMRRVNTEEEGATKYHPKKFRERVKRISSKLSSPKLHSLAVKKEERQDGHNRRRSSIFQQFLGFISRKSVVVPVNVPREENSEGSNPELRRHFNISSSHDDSSRRRMMNPAEIRRRETKIQPNPLEIVAQDFKARLKRSEPINFGQKNAVDIHYDMVAKGEIEKVRKQLTVKESVKMGSIMGDALFALREQLISGISITAGRSYLHVAATKGHLEIVKLLCTNSANVNQEAENESIALHSASGAGHKKVVKYLLENKALVNKENNRGETPLHYACSEGHLEIVQMLIAHHADVNAGGEDAEAGTPLHEASQAGQVQVVRFLLLQNDSNRMVRDRGGLFPIQKAASAWHHRSYEKTYIDPSQKERNNDDDDKKKKRKLSATGPKDQVEHSPYMDVIRMLVSEGGCSLADRRLQLISLIEDYEPAAMVALDTAVHRQRLWGITEWVQYDVQLVCPPKMTQPQPIRKMLEHRCMDLISHPLVDHAIQMKWEQYAMSIFQITVATYTLYMASLVVGILYLDQFQNLDGYLKDTPGYLSVPYFICELIIVAYGAVQLFQTYHGGRAEGWQTFIYTDYQTVGEALVTLALTIAKFVLVFANDPASFPVCLAFQSILIILACTRVFSYLEVQETWGGQIATMKSLTSAFGIFCIVWLVIHMAFVVVFYCLFRHSITEFHSIFSAFVELYVVLVGELELWNSIRDSEPYLGTFFFVLYTVISTVMLLNWLIAMMNHRFNQAASRIKLEGKFAAAGLIINLEIRWLSDRAYEQFHEGQTLEGFDHISTKALSKELTEFAVACEVTWGDIRAKLDNISGMLASVELASQVMQEQGNSNGPWQRRRYGDNKRRFNHEGKLDRVGDDTNNKIETAPFARGKYQNEQEEIIAMMEREQAIIVNIRKAILNEDGDALRRHLLEAKEIGMTSAFLSRARAKVQGSERCRSFVNLKNLVSSHPKRRSPIQFDAKGYDLPVLKE